MILDGCTYCIFNAPYKAQFSHYVGVGDVFVNNEYAQMKWKMIIYFFRSFSFQNIITMTRTKKNHCQLQHP
jgi:hypothetical protein